MKSSAPILDPAAGGPESMYVSHELMCIGDFARAIRDYEKIVKKEPDNIEVLNGLGWAYLEANRNIGRAEGLVRRCVELDPSITTRAYFRDTIGWLEYRRNNVPAAEEHLLCALRATDRLKDGYDYVCILHHLYFVWRWLGKDTVAELARNELASVPSKLGAVRLFVKRTAIDDDSFLIPRCSYLSREWNEALSFTMNRPVREYAP